MAAPARKPLADRGEALQHHIGNVAVLREIGAALLGDGVALLGAIALGGDVACLLEEGQRGIDHAWARAVPAARLLFDQLDQLIAVSRLLGDQGKREQLEVALREHAADAEPVAAAARPRTPTRTSPSVPAKSACGPSATAIIALMFKTIHFCLLYDKCYIERYS